MMGSSLLWTAALAVATVMFGGEAQGGPCDDACDDLDLRNTRSGSTSGVEYTVYFTTDGDDAIDGVGDQGCGCGRG